MYTPGVTQTLLALLAFGAPLASSHSWAEQLRNIDDEGKYVGQYGYPRRMLDRGMPNYSDSLFQWQIPKGGGIINGSEMICREDSRKQQQIEGYPRLQATPNKYIAIRYLENGHVSAPQVPLGKPEGSGTIFIYGTTQPKEDQKLVDVLQWTMDGQGGDKSGQLLSMGNFDDGRCHQMKADSQISNERAKEFPNHAPGQTTGNIELPCESNVKIPADAPNGKPYTIYWVWQWNTLPNSPGAPPEGKDEYYTSCIDVDIVSKDKAWTAHGNKHAPAGGVFADGMTFAVSDYKSRTALMTDAIKGERGPYFSNMPEHPAPTGTGPSPSAVPPPAAAMPTSIGGVPYLNSTAPHIQTLSSRPGAKPTQLPGYSEGANGPVTVTDTVTVTVTAEPTTTPAAAMTRRAANTIHYKNGAKFRGRIA